VKTHSKKRKEFELKKFLVRKGFNIGTLALLNQANLERLAADYGYKGK
jgi:hypothetical protein